MNKRARMRLIGVTAIIVIVIAVLVVTIGNKQVAAFQTISQIEKGGVKDGDRVKVGGAVVAGSWNKQSNPMKFTIKEETDTSGTGATLKVVYSGTAPNTFGDGVVAIVTGTYKGGIVEANEMITKCPSKYSSAVGAIPVGELNKGTSMVGKKDLQVSGYIKPGSMGDASAASRFTLASKTDGSEPTLAVKFTGALPDTVKDGVQVVVTGTLDADGTFTATTVALASK